VSNRCGFRVVGAGQCELRPHHHGPCESSGLRQHNHTCPRGIFTPWTPVCKAGASTLNAGETCRECDAIDATEVLRLAAGGELRRNQKQPSWMHPNARVPRDRMLKWAHRAQEPVGRAAS
jgi:hypothetical protein